MNIATQSKLQINVDIANNTATIFLSGGFSFAAHHEFKTAYKNQLENSIIRNIVVNLADVNYLDSSALGMLLVLRDQVQSANKILTLSRLSSVAARTFDIANFRQMFTIN